MMCSGHEPSGDDFPEKALISGRRAEHLKRAHHAADLLQRDILQGSGAGRVALGSVAEIGQKYGLGRWACRETIGILELRGVARLKAGRGGGLVAITPDLEKIVQLMLLHLYVKRASTAELIEARHIIYQAAIRSYFEENQTFSSNAKPSLAFSKNARNIPAIGSSFSTWFANHAVNGAFRFLILFIDEMITRYIKYSDTGSKKVNCPEVNSVEIQLYKSIMRSEMLLATSLMDQFLDVSTCIEHNIPIKIGNILGGGVVTGKIGCSRRLAFSLIEEILHSPLAGYANLGSELEIGRRHDANPATVRQAIRLLEELAVVVPRRGRGGGIELQKPDVAFIVGILPHLFAQNGLHIRDCFRATGFIELEAAKALATHVSLGGQLASTQNVFLNENVLRQDLIAFDSSIVAKGGNAILTACERGFLLYAHIMDPPSKVDPVTNALVNRISSMTQDIMDRIAEGDVLGTDNATMRKFRFLGLRFAEQPGNQGNESGKHPLNIAEAREQELARAASLVLT